MRREALRRQYVDGGNGVRVRQIGGDKKVEKCFDQLAQSLGLLVAVDQNQQIALGRLPEQNQVKGLGGGGKAGERKRAPGDRGAAG